MKHKILIIHDEAVNPGFVEGYLSDFGFQLFRANSGDEGIEMMEKTGPDLVLMDVNMPGKDGFQTLAEIKNHPKLSAIPVLFLTSYDRTNLKVKGLELGAEDYITRPFHRAELLARIRVALRRTGATKKDDTMEGNLSNLGFIDLLQPFEIGRKNVIVKLIDLDGEVVLENGTLMYVRLGRFTGKKALNRIILAEKGRFTVTFDQITDNTSKEPVKLMKAIMDSVTHIDEVNPLLAQLESSAGSVNPWILITPGVKKLKGAENFRENQVISLLDLIISLEGNLKDIIRNLIKMLKGNTLKFAPVPDPENN